MKVRVPSCHTCGHENIVVVDVPELHERIQRLKGEQAALNKLLDRQIPGEADDSYRRQQLRRLIKKAQDGLNECQVLLEKIE